jgi:hypothetical protein
LHQSAQELDAKPIVKTIRVIAMIAAYPIVLSFPDIMVCFKRFPGWQPPSRGMSDPPTPPGGAAVAWETKNKQNTIADMSSGFM